MRASRGKIDSKTTVVLEFRRTASSRITTSNLGRRIAKPVASAVTARQIQPSPNCRCLQDKDQLVLPKQCYAGPYHLDRRILEIQSKHLIDLFPHRYERAQLFQIAL